MEETPKYLSAIDFAHGEPVSVNSLENANPEVVDQLKEGVSEVCIADVSAWVLDHCDLGSG